MGIDAYMYVKHKGRLTEDQVRRMAGDLSAAFWQGPFSVDRPGTKYAPPGGRHALSIADEVKPDNWGGMEEDEYKREPGEQVIVVNLTGRYYGPGYERGPWWVYASIARWLRRRISGGRVFYGGDGTCGELTPEVENEIWDHFIQNGNDPYHRTDGPECDFCHRKMWNQSSGPYNARGYTCDGCGYQNQTTDGGLTYQPVVSKD